MIEDNRYFWSHLKTRTASVRVQQRAYTPNGIIFRVGNMIDVGRGRQTVMLNPVDYPGDYGATNHRHIKKEVAVPFSMGPLDFVYACPQKPVMRNVNSLLSTLYKKDQLERIVIDVLCPGDLMIFKQDNETQGIQMTDALRVVQEHKMKQKIVTNAL